MDENHKVSSKQDISPIRGLFHKNEKDHQTYHAENGEENDFQENNGKDTDGKKDISPFMKKCKELFSKLADIVTQPEDSMTFSDETDDFNDIFSNEKPAPINMYDEPARVKNNEEQEAFEETETVLFSASSDDEENDITYVAQQNEKAIEEYPVYRSENQQDYFEAGKEFVSSQRAPVQTGREKKNEKIQENKNKQSGQKNNSGKMEISVDTVFQVKESAKQKKPVTVSVSTVKDFSDSSDRLVKENETVNSEENSTVSVGKNNESAKDDTVKENDELSHDMFESNPVVPKQPAINELSHDVPIGNTTVQARNINNELSHDVAEDKSYSQINNAAENKFAVPTGKNELSHDTEKTVSVNEEKKHESTPKIPNTNFSEVKRSAMVYHYSDSTPFVVMAGKFTKTVRTEYEKARKYADAEKNSVPPISDVTVKLPEKSTTESKETVGKNVSENKKEESVAFEADEQSKDILGKDKKPKVAKEKKKLGLKIKDLFAVEENKFDFEEDFIEEKTELNDYNSKEDESDIKNEINESFSKVFIKTIILTVTTVIALCTVFLAELMPSLFLNMIHNGWLVYGIINFIVMAVSVFVARDYITNGFVALFHLRGNSDTAIATASLAGVIQSITALFLPNIYLDGTYNLYTLPIILALLFNCLGKLVIVKRTADNFRFLRSKSAKFVGKIYTKSNNAERMVSGLPVQRPIVAYTKQSKFMSNFLQLSYAPDPVEDNASFSAPFTVALCVLYSFFYGITTKDFIGGVSTFSLTSFITIPICCLLAINLPLKNLCNLILNKGAMISGYDAVRQFSDTNAIMIDSSQIYPKGNIFLSGMRPFDQSKLKDAFRYAAAVSYAVDGPMTHIFETIIQDRKYMVPKVDSVSYDDGLGLTGWIGGNRILMGNRKLMQKHNIKIPDESIETRYRKMKNELVHISLAGELVVMFSLTYRVDNEIAESLRELSSHGVNIIIRTIDQNVTQEHVAEKFNLYQRSIKILPTGLGTICQEEISGTEKTSRAYMVTNGKLSAFAAAVSGCIALKSTITISIVIQSLSVIIGFLLVMVLSFGSGFILLSNIPVLIYTLFCCLVLMIISVLLRKLSV